MYSMLKINRHVLNFIKKLKRTSLLRYSPFALFLAFTIKVKADFWLLPKGHRKCCAIQVWATMSPPSAQIHLQGSQLCFPCVMPSVRSHRSNRNKQEVMPSLCLSALGWVRGDSLSGGCLCPLFRVQPPADLSCSTLGGWLLPASMKPTISTKETSSDAA